MAQCLIKSPISLPAKRRRDLPWLTKSTTSSSSSRPLPFVTAIIFFGIAFPVNNNRVSVAINFAISILVAWVPQGLPATVTMLLTIAAKRMAGQNVLSGLEMLAYQIWMAGCREQSGDGMCGEASRDAIGARRQ